MNCLWRRCGLTGPCLAAVVLAVGTPAPVDATWFGVRNDSNMVVVFQGASVVNNVVRRGKAHALDPKMEGWEFIAPGPKIITVYDRLGRVLFEGNMVAGAQDMFFSIQVGVVAVAPGVLIPQAQLIPAKPTTKPPPR